MRRLLSPVAPACRASWLYGQPELRAEIERLRERPNQGLPAAERPSQASLRQRMRTVVEENRTLRTENRQLKHELALVYSAQRAPKIVDEERAARGRGHW